ncbi:MAG TPA: bifunctional methylenetetrahydrofolate dehydrogenase/methenyltetrahydrofolate cyclohydrolase FolD [Rhodospirillaceae bacterium]|nr:MAG: bifunctional methylenetetrahydrofolate dehydrogenase/methenyltetrahydrofolate cyclohydrolase [Alphaproteobacteria bacterium GWF2_58_20]HAU29725.1 bifunctional methylenetetrahydrofolate dehydrogenase/methenyltetrahydrofolate cyclohydrolase FolD [Rhodospirillaceae bacterium]
MTRARIIDGKAIAAKIRNHIALKTATLAQKHGITPGLAVILVGENMASQTYVRNKARATTAVGMESFGHLLPEETTQENLIALVHKLNADARVHGILVQLPLPGHMNEAAVLAEVTPEKDVDGFHFANVGKLVLGLPCLPPCTPSGILALLKETLGNLDGLRALVIGRSNIVGKPLSIMLTNENCTVTLAHSKTRNIAAECARADIIVSAVGKPEFLRGEWIKPGATVIDVGINHVLVPEDAGGDGEKKKLVGDVCFNEALDVAKAITPVPGGVGPMTIAMLLENTLKAACMQAGISLPEEDPQP